MLTPNIQLHRSINSRLRRLSPAAAACRRPVHWGVKWLGMIRSQYLLGFLAMSLAWSVLGDAYADDELVKAAKSLSARAFDETLPDQSVESWLRAHLPTEYQVVWGEEITDCGEGGGTPIEGRDMPLCAEVVVKRGARMVGYLALMVGTHKRGLLKEGNGLYFGYLEPAGTRYDFNRLGDVLKVK